MICSECKKEIHTRETHYQGANDKGEEYAVHPACWADFIKKGKKVGT